ncbi:hypothetical protein DSO57_1012968 [Entomophthora muscae]|uniref:Uncharacterized protein n=2 Tax=Entomophthora muscae TaxID=34485 RepID=A0ACC2TGE8_9FUNG|nr:hypothetical protein DSO57_1012968 [Entomophthora muscae]
MARSFFPLNIPGRGGHTISGIVGLANNFSPQQSLEGTRPLIVILHGLRDHKNSETITGIEKELPPHFDTFRFDFSGNGDSEGETSYSDYPFQVEDLEIVIQFLETHDFCIPSLDQHCLEPCLEYIGRKLGCPVNPCFAFNLKVLIGHSKGGTVSMLFASRKTCRIPYIINISGRNDLREKSMHRFKPEQMHSVNEGEKIVWRTFTDSNDQKRPIWVSTYDFIWRDEFQPDVFKAIRTNQSIKAVLTVHGTDDTVVPLKDAIAFDNCFPKNSIHTLKVLNGFSHMFLRDGEMKGLTFAINNWLLDRNLVSHL